MKTNFINSTFASLTFLLIAGCASMTQAPSTTPSATVRIQEWSAAYYAQAEPGKATLNYNAGGHHLTPPGGGRGGRGAQKTLPPGKAIKPKKPPPFSRNYTGTNPGPP